MKQRKQEENTLRMELYPQGFCVRKPLHWHNPVPAQYCHHIRAIYHFICDVAVCAAKQKDPSGCCLLGLLQCMKCIPTLGLVYQFGVFLMVTMHSREKCLLNSLLAG